MHQKVFNDMTESVATATTLQYYDPDVPTVLETDTSMKGLGAFLLQRGKPVAFASKSLSTA